MTKAELREKIRALAFTVVGEKVKSEDAALAYDELTKFPELKRLPRKRSRTKEITDVVALVAQNNSFNTDLKTTQI